MLLVTGVDQRRQGLGPAAVRLRPRRPAARAALRYSPWGRAAELASLTAFVSLKQAAASQFTKRAGTRTDPRPAFLAVADAASQRPAPSLARAFGSLRESLASHGHRARGLPRAAGALAGREPGSMPGSCPSLNKERSALCKAAGGWAVARLWGGEARRVSVGVRTRTLQRLTRCGCLSEVSAVDEASSQRDRNPSTAAQSSRRRRPPQRRATAHPPTALRQA
jgi:hypothetical protein